jgi:hypothetical protein
MDASLETIAGDGVSNRQCEKAEPNGHQDQVQHADAPWSYNARFNINNSRQCDNSDADVLSGDVD